MSSNGEVMLYGLVGGIGMIVLSFATLRAVEWFVTRSQRKKYSLKNKVVVITGASSGIGESVAYEAAQKGASLFLVARREDRLLQVANRCNELGSPHVEYLLADVSDPEANKAIVDGCVEKLGQLDVLVLNAGIPANVMFSDLDEEALRNMRKVFDVNFWACVDTAYYAIPHLKKTKGVIVPISSLSTRVFTPGRSLYAASKCAVNSFFGNLRTEISKFGIGITMILPGYIHTEFHQRANEQFGKVEKNMSAFMSSEKCAQKIVNAVENCERECQMGGPLAAITPAVGVIAPCTVDAMALRKAQQGVKIKEDEKRE